MINHTRKQSGSFFKLNIHLPYKAAILLLGAYSKTDDIHPYKEMFVNRIEPRSPALQADSLPAKSQAKPKNTGVGNLSLLQGIFPTQESNWGLLHHRHIFYQLSYQESPLFIIDKNNPNVHQLENKQNVIYSYQRIMLSIYDNYWYMPHHDELQKHYVK